MAGAVLEGHLGDHGESGHKADHQSGNDAAIALAEHPRYRVPVLGDRGAPVGIDVHKVRETGILPVIDIVMMHREAGRGLVGFGLVSPPMACFEQAAQALVSAGSVH